MSLPRHLFTPAFRHKHLGRSFSAIVGIVVFIASFATVAEALLLTAGHLWEQSAANTLTVEIPALGDEAAMPQIDRVRQAVSILRTLPEVERVKPLSDAEVRRLVQPWFNKSDMLKVLPLPSLIDIERKPGATLAAADIQKALKNVLSDARVDDHGVWEQDVGRLVSGLTILGGLTIFLTGLSLIITVSLICRAVMASERDTISLLHLIGTDDKDIGNHFEKQALHISSRAAAAGFLAALGAVGVLLYATRSLADFSPIRLEHWMALSFAALLVPFCAVFIATATARVSILRLIK